MNDSRRLSRSARLGVMLLAMAVTGGESSAAEAPGGQGRHVGARAEHVETGREVHVTEAQRERLQLEISPASAGSAGAIVQAPATVVFDADRIARIGPRLEAKVVEVTKDLGAEVAAGDTVAVLDSVELGRAKARYLAADARLQAAQSRYRRDQQLAEQQITSEAHLLEARAAFLESRAGRDATRAELRLYGLDRKAVDAVAVGGPQPLSRYELTTPVAGVVQQRDLVPGQTVSAEETPIHVVDDRIMWVMIDAYERDVPRLRPGQPVELSVRALPGETFSGETDWVSRELDRTARTLRVRAVVPNPDGVLRAGMFGTARISTGGEARYALVPVDAVQTVEGDAVVFVPGDEDGAFRAVTVTTGEEAGGRVEILSGLRPGDPVITRGAFDLKSALTAGHRSAAHSH